MALNAGAAYIDVFGRLSKSFDRDLEREAGGRLKGVGGKLGGILATGMATAGVAAGAALVKGMSDAIANEKAGDKVAASFGLTPEAQAKNGAIAGRLYADAYGESLAQVAEASANVQRSLGELTDAEVEDLTANALDFAAVFETDVNEAISNAGLLLKNGLVADGEEAFDILTLAMQRTAPAVRDEILAATSEYSTFFADLGVSGEEAFSVLTKAAEKGGNYGVDKVGDALKELTIRATDMSSTSVAAYDAAGLNAEKMAARFLAGGDTARGALDELVGSLQDIEDPVERANAAIGLFGTPLEDLSVSEVPTFLAQLDAMKWGMGETEGAADRMGDTLNDNLGTKLEGLKRGALLKLSTFVEKTVFPAIEKFGPVVEDAVAVVVDKWPEIEATIRPVIEEIVALVEEKWPEIRDTIDEIVGQVVEIVSAFVELALEIWDRFGDEIVTFVTSTFSAIMRVIGGALDVVQGIIETVLGIITGDWSRAWDGVKQILGGVWEIIVGLVEGAIARARFVLEVGLELIKGAFSGTWDSIKNGISSAFDAIVGFFTKLPGRLADAAGDVFGFLWDAFRGVLNMVIDGWNALEFKLPDFEGWKVAGKTIIPAFTGPVLGVPDIDRLEARAMGGPVLAGRDYLVGELGPELLRMGSASGNIIPNHELAGAGRSGVTIERLEVPTVTDATADEVVDAIGSKLGWKLTTRTDR